MRVVGLISGGKDSTYNMVQCVSQGHELVALGNLHPKDTDELDSYMYQSVGHDAIELYAKAMDLPLFRGYIKGLPVNQNYLYTPTEGDEVEDLYNLLTKIKETIRFDAVSVGAILSNYQRERVQNICDRMNIKMLAYLWNREQDALLKEMIDSNIKAILIKVATLGLEPDKHLGKDIKEVHPHLQKMNQKFGINICGEGGEYETFTLDCPLFHQTIKLEETETVISSSDPSVGYLRLTKACLIPKVI